MQKKNWVCWDSNSQPFGSKENALPATSLSRLYKPTLSASSKKINQQYLDLILKNVLLESLSMHACTVFDMLN